MNYKFKNLIFILLIVVIFTLTGCKKKDPKPVQDELTIYTINDFHGAIEATSTSSSSEKGIARVAGYIKEHSSSLDHDYLVLSAGDMFQGTGISNYNHGKDVIDFMNYIKFDAMTLGNHEFDWGIEEITKYRDSDSTNGEANFPFLACNIIKKDTNTPLENTVPYTVINKSGLKVGIIGYIGYGLEQDIAPKVIANYEFTNPVDSIKKYAQELRETKDCDVVIALGHDGDSSTNNQIANLKDNQKVDVIINGHTHSQYVDFYRVVGQGYQIPCIQSGNSGSYVGVINIKFNPETKSLIEATAFNKKMSSSIEEDPQAVSMVNELIKATSHIFQEELCTVGIEMNKTYAGKWAVNTLREEYNADFAFINTGGIRANAFPISANSKVLVSNVFTMVPFDNTVVTLKLQGQFIKYLLANGDLFNSSGISESSIIDDTYYNVVAIDYIVDNTSQYSFYRGKEITNTGDLFRDVLINNLRSLGNEKEVWVG